MDDLTKEFLAESVDGLDRMDRCLTELETSPKSAELLGEIFRAVHTIKGTTGFLGFGRLEKLAHAGEHLLGSLRDGRLEVSSEIISGLLALIDGLRAILSLIERTGGEGTRTADVDTALIAMLQQLNSGKMASGTSAIPLLQGAQALRSVGPPSTERSGEQVSSPGATPLPIVAAGVAEKTLRIDVDVLNRMVNLVGELVLTRNQMLQSCLSPATFPQLLLRLDSVTADLRETVMRARMQPVGHLFSKFPRLVRDLARTCGKQVRLEFRGQETGLDKTLLEAIKDPLTHAVRNAIDHGIESTADRILAGKHPEGLVQLRACHQNGSVVIEVADDGGGISIDRILAKALERGLIDKEQAATMPTADALELIFRPGFSTAEKVTHLSGRGVGMDVVRANVEKVGGTVQIETRAGQGSILRMRVPLTLAIVPALVVLSAGQSFCVPQGALAELVYVPKREADSAIERIGGAEVYRLRDHLLPMIWLSRTLQLDQAPADAPTHGFYLAVLEADGCRFGLVVDDLMSPEEIVVKPLSADLREIGVFSGATVLGNGKLAMILDIPSIAARAGIRPVAKAIALESAQVLQKKVSAPMFLVFEDGAKNVHAERRALPLTAVERIETVPVALVEYAGGRALLQYQDEPMPLEDFGGLLEEHAGAAQEAQVTVLICLKKDDSSGLSQRYGLVVRRVLDVADGSLLESTYTSGGDQLVMVKQQLTVLHGGLYVPGPWKEVA